MLSVTNESFETEVIKSSQLVVTDFWANWCGPCKALAPILQELADDNPDVKVVKVDIDTNQELAGKYNVASIPTIIVFKDGNPVSTTVGMKNKEALQKTIDDWK